MGDEIINNEVPASTSEEGKVDPEAEILAKELGLDGLGNNDETIKENNVGINNASENVSADDVQIDKNLEEEYENLKSRFNETSEKLSAIEKMFAHDENGNILTDESGNPILINQAQTTTPKETETKEILSPEELAIIQEKFDEDPVSAVKEMASKITENLVEQKLQEKLSPIMARIAEDDEAKLQERINTELAEMEKIPDFVEHKNEIAQIFDKYPFVADSEKPYETAYKLYIAENIEKYANQAQQTGVNLAMKNIAAVENSQPLKGTPPTQDKTILTDEEKKIAAKLGLTEDEFLEELKNSKEVI